MKVSVTGLISNNDLYPLTYFFYFKYIIFIGIAAQRNRYRSGNSLAERNADKPGGKKASTVNRNFPPPVPEYSKKSMFIKHIWALTIKRFHHTKRNKKGFIFEVIRLYF